MSESTPVSEISVEGNPEQQVTEVMPVALDTNKVTKEAKLPGKPKTSKQTRDQNKKFFEIGGLTLSLVNVTSNWTTVTWDPFASTGEGAAFNLPFKRHLNYSGERMTKGYSVTIPVTLLVATPPQVSGTLEIVDSLLQTGRYFYDFTTRGEVVTVPVVLTLQSAQGYPIQARHYLQPQQRCSQSKIGFRYRICNMNRTAEIADVKVTYIANLGKTVFDRPVKPRPRRTNPTYENLIKELSEEIAEVQLMNDDIDYIVGEMADEVDHGEMEEVDGDYDESNEHDTFMVPIFDDLVDIGSDIVIPMNIPIMQDISNTSDESTITQPWDRYAHGFCTKYGNYGPIAGQYVINIRLPTTIAGQVQHICLPGDEMPEIFSNRFLGLSPILDLAGSVLSSIGGPLVGGFLNTAVNAVGGLLGMGNQPDQQPAAQAQPYQITGEIPVSRFPAFIKPIAENFAEEPIFGGLLMKLVNFLDSTGTRALPRVPVQVFAKMDGMRFDRLLTNRTITPRATMANQLYLPLVDVPELIRRLGNDANIATVSSNSNIMLTKLLKCCQMKLAKKTLFSKSIGFDEFQAMQVSVDECRTVVAARSYRKLRLAPEGGQQA